MVVKCSGHASENYCGDTIEIGRRYDSSAGARVLGCRKKRGDLLRTRRVDEPEMPQTERSGGKAQIEQRLIAEIASRILRKLEADSGFVELRSYLSQRHMSSNRWRTVADAIRTGETASGIGTIGHAFVSGGKLDPKPIDSGMEPEQQYGSGAASHDRVPQNRSAAVPFHRNDKTMKTDRCIDAAGIEIQDQALRRVYRRTRKRPEACEQKGRRFEPILDLVLRIQNTFPKSNR